MKTLNEFTVNQLRSAISSLNNGMICCQVSGNFSKEEIRAELKRRTGSPYGYNEGVEFPDENNEPVNHNPPPFLTVCIGI